jgi:Tol biopolymer transport system component
MQGVTRTMRTRRAIILLGGALALLFLASALVSTETTSAQTTSPSGNIVYVKLGDIWVMDADGTNQTNLTNTPDTNEGQPAWSPDGTKIAFTGPGKLNEDNSGGLEDIYVMDADPTTDDATSLTNTPNSLEYQPSWAPSGAQLTFVREVPGEIISEQADIFVMDTDPASNDAINLTQTDASERHPDWSPDGAKIAFSGVRNGGEEILTMDPDGQNEEILSGDGFDGTDEAPEWSPDGTKVVFQKQSQVGGCCGPWEIWGVNRDGSGDTNLTPNDLSDEDRLVTQHTGPSWSPDGSEIIFTRTRPSVEGGQSDIYAMPAPTTLPPPSETASVTTSQDRGAMEFAASDVVLQAASAQTTSETTVRQLTTDGLSTEPDWADTPADTTPPKVMSTSPANGASLIAPGVNVTATFSEAMDARTTDGDASTINGTTFKLATLNADGTTTRVTAVVRYVAATKKAILNPSSNLSSGRSYKATVTTGAQDLAGNTLDQNQNIANNQSKNWKFTVK